MQNYLCILQMSFSFLDFKSMNNKYYFSFCKWAHEAGMKGLFNVQVSRSSLKNIYFGFDLRFAVYFSNKLRIYDNPANYQLLDLFW